MSVQYTFLAVQQALLQTRDRTQLCKLQAQPLRGGGAYMLFVYFVGNVSIPLTTGSLHYSLKTHKMVSVCYTIQQECCKQVEFVPPGVTDNPFPASLREKRELM
ncbi:hypothetical protein JG687_00005327 [Phytophthora cactorum]|uniref:Uncharacterized protein n=1 Tax=Phytophthora cactorum TaxID=29920 RepID=A0A8T1UL78_9STRA|nr:hypothetical protein JG687_00005327 [Phytophthora cactorum]